MDMPVISEVVHGARSFWLKNDRVELFITEIGGHLGPVAFKLKHRWVRIEGCAADPKDRAG
jgi:predicted alpha/beta-fold hydrolase